MLLGGVEAFMPRDLTVEKVQSGSGDTPPPDSAPDWGKLGTGHTI